MSFSVGIIGLPNVGKTTIFNAITSICAEASNYPFCTIDPNVGVVPVNDERLPRIAEIIKTEGFIPTTITMTDIAGLVKGSSRGEGLGNKFLSHIREVDGIAHVVRCFDLGDIVHVEGSVDPVRDIEIIKTELALSDIEILEKRIDKLLKMKTAENRKLADIFEHIVKALNSGEDGRAVLPWLANCSEDERKAVAEMNLIMLKPVFYIANVDEKELKERRYLQKLSEYAGAANSEIVAICGRLEEELAQFETGEKMEMLREYDIDSDAVQRIVRTGYRALNLITYFTTARKELKAWTIEDGTTALKAAGKIHTDFERGFIRAEVIGFDDLVREGSEHRAREHGLYRLEGKEYRVRDGDVVYFRFKV